MPASDGVAMAPARTLWLSAGVSFINAVDLPCPAGAVARPPVQSAGGTQNPEASPAAASATWQRQPAFGQPSSDAQLREQK